MLYKKFKNSGRGYLKEISSDYYVGYTEVKPGDNLNETYAVASPVKNCLVNYDGKFIAYAGKEVKNKSDETIIDYWYYLSYTDLGDSFSNDISGTMKYAIWTKDKEKAVKIKIKNGAVTCEIEGNILFLSRTSFNVNPKTMKDKNWLVWSSPKDKSWKFVY